MVVILYFCQFWTSALKFGLSAGFASCRSLSNPLFDRDDWTKVVQWGQRYAQSIELLEGFQKRHSSSSLAAYKRSNGHCHLELFELMMDDGCLQHTRRYVSYCTSVLSIDHLSTIYRPSVDQNVDKYRPTIDGRYLQLSTNYRLSVDRPIIFLQTLRGM